MLGERLWTGRFSDPKIWVCAGVWQSQSHCHFNIYIYTFSTTAGLMRPSNVGDEPLKSIKKSEWDNDDMRLDSWGIVRPSVFEEVPRLRHSLRRSTARVRPQLRSTSKPLLLFFSKFATKLTNRYANRNVITDSMIYVEMI